MIRFKQFINEAIFGKLVSLIKKKIRAALAKLSFGRSKKIVINMKSLSEEADPQMIDTKSRLGFYSEFVTAYYLADNVEKSGGRLTSSSSPNTLKELMNKKKSSLVDIGAKADEITRMDSAGMKLAEAVFEDIVLGGNDYPALEFDIKLTGDLEKGVSKSDLILTVRKLSKEEIIDQINASLKAYKTGQINLSNSTFMSLFSKLFYDIPPHPSKFIEKFAKDFGSAKELKRLYDLQNIIKTEMAKGASKIEARKKAKDTHIEVIELIIKIFESSYKKNKQEINKRMIKMLGFDGGDDFYAAIGKTGSQKVVSSRKSKEMKKMLKKLEQNFELSIKRNGRTKNADILFLGPDGDIITSASLTFTDTGGKSAQGKTNAFVNIGKF